MKKLTISLVVTALGFSSAKAQPAGAIQQVDNVQQRRQFEQSAQAYETGESAPELFPGEASDVGPQSVLRIKPRRTWLEVMGDAQYFYTDNMFLNDHDEVDTDVLVSTIQIALAPTAFELPCGKIAPRLGYRHQWFNFGLASDKRVDAFDANSGSFRRARLSEFDFNAQTIFADGRWTHGNWIVEAGLDHTRLMDSDDYGQFYDEYVPRWCVQRIVPLCEKSALSLGYAGDYRFTGIDTPSSGNDFNDRTDHAAFVVLNCSICPRAVVQPFYRFTYTHYTNETDRDDYLNSFGLALYCPITRQVGVRAFVGYDIKCSDGLDAADDYERLDVGGGLNVFVRF